MLKKRLGVIIFLTVSVVVKRQIKIKTLKTGNIRVTSLA